MIKYVLFDLDGTLLSTLDTITYHLNGALIKHGLGQIDIDDTRVFIGNGARKLVTRAVNKSGVTDLDLIEQVLVDYNRAYDSDPLPHTFPYDGIPELVDELCSRGVRLGVVTNKPHPTALKLVEHFFAGRFSCVSGGREGITLKPDPIEALSVLASMGGIPSESAFVGDTSVDVITGRNMKAALSVGVAWGFRAKGELVEAGASFVIDHASELLPLIDG